MNSPPRDHATYSVLNAVFVDLTTWCEECEDHMLFVEEPELFLEGDCAADMGALLAISCCWDDCSAPISLSFGFVLFF